MAGSRPEERVAVPVVRQSWRRVAFIHWPVEPDAIRPLLPEGLAVDVRDGAAWVGLTPFRVERFRVLGAAPLPFASSFPETNLRTYVRDRHGRDGLWFVSLDVPSLANVAGGRSIGAPYFWSTMSVDGDDVVRYRARRRVGRAAGHDIAVRPGAPLADGDTPELVAALTGRWRAFTVVAGRVVAVPVQHEPWPLRAATLEHLDETIVAAAGLPAPAGAPLVHFSAGVDARLGPPRLVGDATGR